MNAGAPSQLLRAFWEGIKETLAEMRRVIFSPWSLVLLIFALAIVVVQLIR